MRPLHQLKQNRAPWELKEASPRKKWESENFSFFFYIKFN